MNQGNLATKEQDFIVQQIADVEGAHNKDRIDCNMSIWNATGSRSYQELMLDSLGL